MTSNSIITGNWETKVVCIDGIVLSPSRSQEYYNHSPDGFNWSYSGSGPSQLALALLLEATNFQEAMFNYHHFKGEIIAGLPSGDFTLNASVIYDWLRKQRG